MKITAIETLRAEEFANVLWVRVHTDTGIIGLGETFHGAGAVEAHIHETFGALVGFRGDRWGVLIATLAEAIG